MADIELQIAPGLKREQWERSIEDEASKRIKEMLAGLPQEFTAKLTEPDGTEIIAVASISFLPKAYVSIKKPLGCG